LAIETMMIYFKNVEMD